MSEHIPRYDHVNYLEALNIEKFRKKLPIALGILKHVEFDAIAFRGLSGALSAIPLAHALNKTMIAVRKSEENNHSSRAVEGDKAARRYIVVDDTISSGNTVRTIIRAVKRFAPRAECVGILLWLSLCESEPLMAPDDWQITPVYKDGESYNMFGERIHSEENNTNEELPKANEPQTTAPSKEEVPPKLRIRRVR